MMYLNQTKLMGFLGADPEIRTSQKGHEVAVFSVGVNQKRKNKDGKYEDVASWFKVSVLHSALVNITKEYLKRGTRVLVTGELRNNKWTDDQGKEHFATEVVLTEQSSILFENKADLEAAASQQSGDKKGKKKVA